MPTTQDKTTAVKNSSAHVNQVSFDDIQDDLITKKVKVIGYEYRPPSQFTPTDDNNKPIPGAEPVTFSDVTLFCMVKQQQPYGEGFSIGFGVAKHKINLMNNHHLSHTHEDLRAINNPAFLPMDVELSLLEVVDEEKKGKSSTVKPVDFRILKTNNGKEAKFHS